MLRFSLTVFFAVFVSLLLVFAVVSPALAAPRAMIVYQGDDTAPADPPPIDQGGTGMLVAMAVAVAGFVEYVKNIFLKPLAEKQKWDDGKYRVIVYSVAILSGLGAALIAGPEVDFFRMIGIDRLPAIFGVLASGVIVAFGEQFAHWALDYGRAGVAIMRAKEEQTRVLGQPIPAIQSETLSPIAMLTSLIGSPELEAVLNRHSDLVEQRVISKLNAAAKDSIAAPPIGAS